MKIMDLIETLQDQDSDIRTDAARALGRIGVDTILALIQALQDQDSGVRYHAVEALRKIEAESASWNPEGDAWNQKFQALLAYKSTHGNYNVSKSYNLQLSRWVNRQRQLKRKDKLAAEKTERLETNGFSWNPIEDAWNQMFEALQQYKSNNGDCDVPQSYPPNQKLGNWVGTQRTVKKSGKLSSDKIQKLNQLGFSWNPIEDAWNQMFEALQQYKSNNGDCDVPQSYPPNQKLGNWVGTQRIAKKSGKLSSDKIQKLETNGFSWNPIEDAWNQMFEALQQYKSSNDDCNVPQSYPPNQKLGNWVGTQRVAKKNGKLSSDKIQKLNQLGFSWTRKPTKPTQESPQLPLFD